MLLRSLFIPNDYPGMEMSAREQTEFVAKFLGPAFRDAHLKTKILVFDHNWDLIDFPFQVMSDPAAASFASGIATHCYGGVPSVQNILCDTSIIKMKFAPRSVLDSWIVLQ